jgi:hypothetical protein
LFYKLLIAIKQIIKVASELMVSMKITQIAVVIFWNSKWGCKYTTLKQALELFYSEIQFSPLTFVQQHKKSLYCQSRKAREQFVILY